MREYIKASDEHILTNGEIYGTIIFLAKGLDPKQFKEISLEEYQKIMNEENEERPL